jgi:hypothetical protein
MRYSSAKGLVVAVVISIGGGGPATAQQTVDMPGEDRPLRADFEEVYRIGSIGGEVWETFGEIAGTAFDAAGNLYVFDRQGSRITMVDPSGRFLREVGKAGDGPGEFRMAMQFTVMRDGRLVVADLGHRAYHLFDGEGQFERMVSMGDGGGTIRMGEIAPHPRGDAIISGGGATVIAMRAGPGGAGPDEPGTRPIDLVSLAGEEASVRPLAQGWQPPPADPATLEGGRLRFQMSVGGPRTFEPPLLVGALPNGGVVFSDSSAYALKVAAPEGGVSRILRRPFRPEPVTERIREAEKERRLAELEAGDGPQFRVMTARGGGAAQALPQEQVQEMVRGRIEQMQFFHELPVIQNLAASWTGKIWVERRGEELEGPGAIDVLTVEGRYMGTFAAGITDIPSAFGPQGLAAYVELDELDVPSVIVRRLPPVLN